MSTPPGAGDPTRHNLHRGGLADDPARLRPHPTLFARIGGRAVVARIIDTFYDRVQADSLLGPLFDHSERHNIIARDRQRRFFEEWLGGDAGRSSSCWWSGAPMSKPPATTRCSTSPTLAPARRW